MAVGYFFLVFFGLFLVPESITYSKGGIAKLVPLGLVVGFVPVLVLLMMKLLQGEKDLEKKLRMLLLISGLLGFPAAIVQDYYRLAQMEMELKANGLITQGVVSERTRKYGKGYSGYQIVVQFSANGNAYNTFKQNDENDQYREGDSLDVIYLKRNPEISRVLVFEEDW